jgi:Flp pilus assembly protein TadB
MTIVFIVSVALAAVCGILASALYLAWPRMMAAEEWIYHRRAVSGQAVAPARRVPGRRRAPSWLTLERYGAYLTSLNADLALVNLADEHRPDNAAALLRRLGRVSALATSMAVAVDIVLWSASGGGLAIASAALLAAAAGVGAPLVEWTRLRRRARSLRASINRRLARVLTGARMVLESGAATPERALVVAVGIYDDPATQLLREALRMREVRRWTLEEGLDQVAERYQLTDLYRLADAFRLGGRYGTKMAEVLAGFAADLRRATHADFRERMTRAPVLMTLPALAFFVAPLLVLILYLVFAPLSRTLGQL